MERGPSVFECPSAIVKDRRGEPPPAEIGLRPPRSTLDESAMDRRILVVDDSELTCQQLSQLLARPDRRIKVAHDGTVAMEWLVEGHFSLVLTDLCLPGVDGMDLIREIRH